MSFQRHRELAFRDLCGPTLTASEPALVYSAQKRTNWLASMAAGKCKAKEQKAKYAITSWPICHYPNGACALSDADKSLATLLAETCPTT